MEEMILNAVSQLGFPAVICLYTLFGVNKTMKELTAAINKQTAEIERRESEQSCKIDKMEDELKELKFQVQNLKDKGG